MTISVPTTRTAISAAASPATQTGPRRSRPSTRLDRTRSGRSELGDPLMRSNASFSSRRKLSFDKSEHLLERKVGAQSPRGAVDARLRGRRRYAQRACDLVQRKIEVEVQDQGQPFVCAQSQQRRLQVRRRVARRRSEERRVGKGCR